MSKSPYNFRKRRTEDRFAELEEKVARLTDIHSKRKVKAPCGSPRVSRSSSKSSVLGNQNDHASNSEYLSEDLPSKKVSRASTSIKAGTSRVSAGDGKSSDEASPSPPSETMKAVSSDKADSLLKELFGFESENAWNDLISQKWRDMVLDGMTEAERTILIKKYMPPNEMDFLKAPRRNIEIKKQSMIKWDEDASVIQDQAGAGLYAFREAISIFLRPKIQISLSPEDCLAVAKINDGAKIFIDTFHQLTLFRRKLLLAYCNSAAKDVAHSIPADNLIFGASFGEEYRKWTTSLKMLSNDISKSTETMSEKTNSSRIAQDFPGCREVFRQAFIIQGTPKNALDVTVASITEATMAKSEEPLRLWWYYCQSNQIDYFRSPIKSIVEFLITSFLKVDSCSTLNSYYTAIRRITKNHMRYDPIIDRFFEIVKVLKP